MDNCYMYGTECPICHDKNPGGRYLPHQSRFVFCGKHTTQEKLDWESQPSEPKKGGVDGYQMDGDTASQSSH